MSYTPSTSLPAARTNATPGTVPIGPDVDAIVARLTEMVTAGIALSSEVPASQSPYATTIGDGTSTSFLITHGKGTKDVQVTVYSTAAAGEEHEPVIEHTSTNTVTVKYNTPPAANGVRVVVR